MSLTHWQFPHIRSKNKATVFISAAFQSPEEKLWFCILLRIYQASFPVSTIASWNLAGFHCLPRWLLPGELPLDPGSWNKGEIIEIIHVTLGSHMSLMSWWQKLLFLLSIYEWSSWEPGLLQAYSYKAAFGDIRFD